MLPGARLHVGAKNNLLASRCWLDSFNTITIHCPLRSRSTLQLSILWFAGVVFEDAPEGRVYVRVFVGMTVRALCECLRCIVSDVLCNYMRSLSQFMIQIEMRVFLFWQRGRSLAEDPTQCARMGDGGTRKLS
jgi:hypothetical protein